MVHTELAVALVECELARANQFTLSTPLTLLGLPDNPILSHGWVPIIIIGWVPYAAVDSVITTHLYR